MKFVIKNYSGENVVNPMRRIGYYFLQEKESELSFVRTLERSGYPRFHIYLKVEGENLIFDLHLDQKRPIYKSVPAHAGEYEGKVVEDEAERIKQTLINYKNSNAKIIDSHN